MTNVPQIIVTLLSDGSLAAELPGPMATRRKVELRPGEVENTLKRILNGQLLDRTEIGLDGAPTAQQVRHWEQHQIWPGSGCRFCIAEGRILVTGTRAKKHVTVMKRSDGVEVRRLAPGQSGIEKVKKPRAARNLVVAGTCKKSATDIGL